MKGRCPLDLQGMDAPLALASPSALESALSQVTVPLQLSLHQCEHGLSFPSLHF